MGIKQNLLHINNEIAKAADISGRKLSDIKLVGVTKSVGVDVIHELIQAGVTDFGENRVQDFLPKYDALKNVSPPTWHFIGHLQRNKVKFIIDKVAMIHSVDNMGLAVEIDKRAGQHGRVMNVFAEVNIAEESSKHGLSPKDVIPFTDELLSLTNIQLKGLMCIAPFVENPEDNRVHFKHMRNLLLDINKRGSHNLVELSMGMSGDFIVAIEEGATIVRVGTALVA